MNIAYESFTPVAALAGGVLIGIACAIYVLGNGRIAGIAGIVASPLRCLFTGANLAAESTRLLFIGGLLLAPWLWQAFAPLPSAAIAFNPALLIVAGLLVGVGVRLGNGCTSGHGVCGLSRLSLRSLVNVMSFMGAGFATVFALRHLFA